DLLDTHTDLTLDLLDTRTDLTLDTEAILKVLFNSYLSTLSPTAVVATIIKRRKVGTCPV
ncbi:hypothetical protein L9G15_26075, partial [Shewanella sp. A3A]|nr:hypothetical protein [Shewanella ferrihydritica]